MTNVSQTFNEQYLPVKALLIYQSVEQENDNYEHKPKEVYVESYDIGKNGKPINAHPLSVKEMVALSEILQATQELKNNYLQSKGVLSPKLVYVHSQNNGYAIWHTPPQEIVLFFSDSLGIPSGKVKIPTLLWKATRDSVQVFALKGKAKPTADTALYYAPFFNLSQDGRVCMGTVNIQIDRQTCLEDFMAKWESYFFNSYFTHTLGNYRHCKGNLIQLWQEQVATGRDFPQDELIKNGRTLKDLIR
ncbi:PRTRC system protein B [Mucilaginibacter sp. X4EP1]|uniref:PRTRC system protein B n=1 Tax=Mucilaginibacter sp. X4EP1 TaxID=2723092 RepID=UPI00216A6A54|nr:PRTRC system protein B [Mucilaginibacter sp. X4EP1]MCS3811452.1 PRTRC genetic system protein B [Mucilaginibacter sp. X4EP1]